MELWRHAASLVTWRSRGICLWRCAAGVASLPQELWRRAVGVATWRCGALEAHCRCSDEEARRYRDGLQACRHGGVEVWSSGVLEMRCRRCLFASRALEACCGCV